MFPKKKARRDAEGAVITEPRNFYTRRPRKGAADDVLFSKPSYNCKGEPYVANTLKGGRTFPKETYKKGGHEIDFKPAKVVHEKVPKAAYPYIPQGANMVKKNYRDAEGAVITEPPNFLTTRMKKGKVGKGTSFGGVIPYMPDDYNIRSKIAMEELKKH